MHYDIGWLGAGFRLQTLDATGKDPSGGAAPARVQQGNPLLRGYQVHRHTVGNRHGEQDSGCRRDPAINPLDLNQAAAGIEAHELDTMYLVAEGESVELRQLTSKGEPPGHHVADWFPAP
jgi:hypothetical protein